MKSTLLCTFMLLLLCASSWAQQLLQGVVTDKISHQPIIGATITAGKQAGTVTNAEGRFTLKIPTGITSFQVTSVGFKSQVINIKSEGAYSILLEIDEHSLEQVVVVGYGTQKKANLTGAVSTVDIQKTLTSRPITDIARGLQGSTPGLTITTSSGAIGQDPVIRLRGNAGSVNTGAAGAKPLILLDNVEIPSLQMVNPADIASISVLKDAASTSIYGTRAAWGVILITSKSGKKGARNQVTYSNNFSWSKPTTLPKIAPAADGAEMTLRALQRTTPSRTDFGVIGMYFDAQGIQKIRDWQAQYGNQQLSDEMVQGRDFEIRGGKLYFYRPWKVADMYLRDWTPQQTHDVSMSGGNDKTTYYLGLGYLGQKGVLKVNPDEFNRYNATLSVNSSVKSWLNVRGKAMFSRTKNLSPYTYSSATFDPWYYLYRWPEVYPYGTFEGKPFRNTVTEVQQAKMNTEKTNLARISAGATFKIAKGLTLDADYTYTNNNVHLNETGGTVTAWDFWSGSLNYGPYTSPSFNKVKYTSTWYEQNTFKAFATYIKDIQQHSFKLIAGTDIELYRAWDQGSERRDLLDPDKGEIPLAIGDQFVTGSRSHWATAGYFGRINYAYKNKLLLELNGRFDGSSRFPRNDQWAFFPSMSAGYILTEEPFMQFARPVLSNFKVRGSWGSVGNQIVGDYQFLPVMPLQNSNWLIGKNNMPTFGLPKSISPSLTWETVATLDLGFDARFLQDKLGLSFDWYRRTTSNMLTPGVTLPSSFGNTPSLRNYGTLQTTGWEIALDFNHVFNNGLRLTATAVLSDYQEKITKYANTTKSLPNPIPGLNKTYYEGQTLGEIWGYQTDRFFTKDDFQQDASGNLIVGPNGRYLLKNGIPSQSRYEETWFFYGPGDIKYKDLDGDGKIDFGARTVDNHGDMRVIGNATPRYQYGLRLGANWKGFDIDVFFQGVGKRDYWASGPIFIPGFRTSEAWYAHQMDYWTPENPNAYYPRPTDQGQSNDAKNFLPQTKYMLNMAYTRLKNLTVGYTLPKKLTDRIHIDQLRVYFSGENLAEIDHLKIPIDPEVDYTSAGLNDANTFGRVYPYRRAFSFGLQVSF